jgi:hypothetical protein
MAEMPDFGSFADANIVIDVTAFVYVIVVHLLYFIFQVGFLFRLAFRRAQRP